MNFETTQIPILEISNQLEVIWSNSSFRKIFNLHSELDSSIQLKTLGLFQMIVGEGDPFDSRSIQRDMMLTYQYQSEFRFLKILDIESTDMGLRLWIDDVSDLNQSTLKTASLDEQKVLKLAKMGTFKTFFETGLIEWDEISYEIHGWDPREFIDFQMYFEKVIDPDTSENIKAEFFNKIKRQKPFYLEYKIRKPSTEIRWIKEYIEPIFDIHGVAIGAKGAKLDITEFKIVEEDQKTKQAQLLKLLKQSESELYRSQVSVRLASWRYNIKSARYVYSHNAADLLDLDDKDITLNIYDLSKKLYPNDFENVKKIFDNINHEASTGSVVVNRMVRGKSKYFIIRYELIFNKNEVVEIIGTHQDITEIENTKRELAKSESLFRGLFEMANAGIVLCNIDGSIAQANPYFSELIGYSNEELMTYTLDEITPKIFLEKESYLNQTLNRKNTSYRLKKQYIKSNSAVVWVEITVSKIYEFYLTVILDIDEQEKQSQALKASEKLLNKTQRIARIAHWHYDLIEDSFNVSDNYKQLFDIAGEFKGLRVFEETLNLVVDEDVASYKMYLSNLLNSDVSNSIDFKITGATGIRYLQEELHYEFNVKNQIIQVIGTLSDLTAEKLLYRKDELLNTRLRQSDKLSSIGVLASGIAHEINNPNSIIMLNSSFLSKYCHDLENILIKENEKNEIIINNIPFSKLKGSLKKKVDEIKVASQKIKIIIHDMKDFVRIGDDDFKQIELNKCILSAVRLTDAYIKKATKSFQLKLCYEDLMMKGDAQHIEQVLINLITNATQSLMSTNQQISITTFLEKNEINLVVEDNGSGISDSDLEKVFDPFFTTKRSQGGTGLGLSISHSIIEKHKGSILILSTLGKGTKVHLKFKLLKGM